MPSSAVIDTSAVVHSITDGGHLGIKARHFFRTAARDLLLIAPPLFLAEGESTLNLWRLKEGKTKNQLQIARQSFDEFGITITHLSETHALAREIADNLRLPRVYDATFAALAMLSGVDYYTADMAFLNAAQRKYRFVKSIYQTD
jgi:predicted nucleic acid-binding protein